MNTKRYDLRIASVLFALAMAACGGDAESREDLEGEALDMETPPAASAPAPAPAPAPRPEATAPSPSTPAAPVRAIPAGTRLTFEVREDVSTSSHTAGDGFALVLRDEVRGTGGAMIPAGATARGVVSEARTSQGPEDEALLAVRLASVQVNGSSIALPGTVESADTRASTRDSGARTGATIATGAAAGALIGQILGRDTRSTVTGAAVGTVAGTVVALTTRGGHASLPAGSTIVVRLDEDVAY
jgi:predicted extracellular nuclease